MGSGGRPRSVLWLVMVGGLIALLEVGSTLAIAVLNSRVSEPIERRSSVLARQRAALDTLLSGQGELMVLLDPELGWVYRPGHVGEGNRITEQGLRGARLYDTVPGEALRVAAFGDSFVYGNEVADEEAWARVAERSWPDLDLLNYGVGGYGMDQAYLRFLREGADLSPDMVLMGFTPVNLGRLVNVYRRFVSSSEIPLVKPRFVETPGGSLARLETPLADSSAFRRLQRDPSVLRSLGRHDWWYRPDIWANPLHDISATVRLVVGLWIRVDRRYVDRDRPVSGSDGSFRPESSAFRLQVAVADSFAARIREGGRVPVVLLLPDRPVLEARRLGQPASWDALMEAFHASGTPVLDATQAFLAEGITPDALPGWFASGGHYSPLGNERVGEWVAGELARLAVEACAAGALRPAAC